MYNPNIKDFPIIPNLLTFVAGPTIAASGTAVTISSNLIVNGFMGVGGFAPVQQLHVDGGGSGGVGIKLTNNGSGHTITDGFSLDMDSSQEVHFRIYEGSGNRGFYWHTNNGTDQIMRLAGDGTLTISSDLIMGGGAVHLQNNGGNLLNINGGFTLNNGAASLTAAGGTIVTSAGLQITPGGPTLSDSSGDLIINRGVFVSSGNSTGAYVEIINTNVGGKNWGLTSTGTGNPEGAGYFVIADGGHSGIRFLRIGPGGVIVGNNASINQGTITFANSNTTTPGITGPQISVGGIGSNPYSLRDLQISLDGAGGGFGIISNSGNTTLFGVNSSGDTTVLGTLKIGGFSGVPVLSNSGTTLITSAALGVTASIDLGGGGVNLSNSSGVFVTTSSIRASTSSTTGTFLSLLNSDTGGRNFTLSSTGTGNTEGAGSFILVDVTASNARRMMIDPSGNFIFRGPSFTFDDPTNAAQNPYLAQGAYSGINKLLLVGDKIQFEASDGPILSRIAPFRLRVEDQLQISSGPILSNNATALEISSSLIVDGIDLTIGAASAPIVISSTSNILSITGSGYANIFAPGSTSRAGLAAGGSTGSPDDYGQRSFAIRNINANGGHFYPIVVGGAIDTYVPLRILRGRILGNGTIDTGEGFTSSNIGGNSNYLITYNTPFLDTPSVVVTGAGYGGPGVPVASVRAESASSFRVTLLKSDDNTVVDAGYNFTVIGIRRADG